jgi:hypothetical protein
MSSVETTPVIQKKVKPIRYFRILAGFHGGKCVVNEDGEPTHRPIIYGVKRPPDGIEDDQWGGDLVPDTADLCKKFNYPGSIKFEEIFNVNPSDKLSPVALAAKSGFEIGNTANLNPSANDPFDDMTIPQLQAHAQAEEIPLGKAKTKEEIIKILRSAPQ